MAKRRDDLYERDFFSWTIAQAEALRDAERSRIDLLKPVDFSNLAAEIEDMDKDRADELESALRILLLHLLIWQFRPVARSSSWNGSIVEHRRRALRLLERNAALKPHVEAMIRDAYEDAREHAAAETGLGERVFPEECPWGWEELVAQELSRLS